MSFLYLCGFGAFLAAICGNGGLAVALFVLTLLIWLIEAE